MRFKEFIEELRHRGVFKIASIYGVTAWLLAQIVGLLFPMFYIPVPGCDQCHHEIDEFALLL